MRNSSKPRSADSSRRRPKPQRTYPASPQKAADAFHDLLHEYDAGNHYPFAIEDWDESYDGYSMVFDPDAVSPSIGRRSVKEVTVNFVSDFCQVIYEYTRKPQTGKRARTTVDEEETQQHEYFADIFYDDPELLEKVFRAIVKLGVDVPFDFGPTIRQTQQSLTAFAEDQD